MAMLHFEVKDAFSFSLVATVPKKVVNWLARLEQNLNEELTVVDETTRNSITVSVDASGGSLRSIVNGKLFSVLWLGSVNEPDSVLVTHEELLDAGNNLSAFIEFEKAFYNTLDSLEARLADKEFETPYTENATMHALDATARNDSE